MVKVGRQFRRAMVVAVACSVLTACGGRAIGRIRADPERYRNRAVTVKGVVTESLSVLARGAYQVEDRSGRLWVITDRGTPGKAARVTVRGTIRQGFNLGPLADLLNMPALGSGFVLVESSRDVRGR